MLERYNKAFSEVIEVINNSSETVIEKIPKSFIGFLEKNKDENYIANIDFKDKKWEKTVSRETRVILALIYRDYLVSQDERKRLIEKEEIEKNEFEKQLREQYNPDNIFNRNTEGINRKEETIQKEVALVEYKESILKRIIAKIKSIFYKNKQK